VVVDLAADIPSVVTQEWACLVALVWACLVAQVVVEIIMVMVELIMEWACLVAQEWAWGAVATSDDFIFIGSFGFRGWWDCGPGWGWCYPYGYYGGYGSGYGYGDSSRSRVAELQTRLARAVTTMAPSTGSWDRRRDEQSGRTSGTTATQVEPISSHEVALASLVVSYKSLLIAFGACLCSQPTEWQHIGNQIDAAMILERSGFVNVAIRLARIFERPWET
jgi:hypothetical protein